MLKSTIALLLFAACVTTAAAEQKKTTFDDLKIIASLKQRLAKQTNKKEADVLVINYFKIPLIIGVYDTKMHKIEKSIAQISPDAAHKIPQDFFDKYIGNKTSKKIALGCAYGNEIQTIGTSYFKPMWIGITLDDDDLQKLSSLLSQSKAVWISMLLLGNNPIIFINDPQSNTVIHFTSSEVQAVCDAEKITINKMLESPEIYRLLWEKQA